MSKNNENTEVQNDETKNQNCKPMISSLYGLENKIRSKENVEDILKFVNSFHKEAVASFSLDDCNDQQLDELKQLSGNEKSIPKYSLCIIVIMLCANILL